MHFRNEEEGLAAPILAYPKFVSTPAKLAAPLTAEIADSTADDRIHSYAVSHFHAGHILANSRYFAGELMPQHQRASDTRKFASQNVDVRATYSNRSYTEQEVAFGRHWRDGMVLQGEIIAYRPN